MKRLSAQPPLRAGLAALSIAALSIGIVLLGGCASPAGIAPQTPALTAAQVGIEGAVAGQAGPAADWWRAFGDPALDALVDRALTDSPGLQAVQARLARAAAGVAGAQAGEGLQLKGSFDATRQRFSANSIYPPPLGGAVLTTATVQAGASWEADFFGRHRAAIEAAVGLQRAAQADLQAARALLASQVAQAYVQLGRLFEQRAVAQRALAQRDEILALVRQRVQAGLDTSVELRQGEAALPEGRQQIEQIDEQVTLARHALAALTAQPQSALVGLVPGRMQPLQLPDRLPADLLARRADITAARWRIEAAGSDMASQRAAFYPDINLGAFVGLSSIGLGELFKSGSLQYGVGPALHLPLFDSGRLRAQLRGKAADVDAAVAAYNAALVEAVHETGDQIETLRSIARQQALQREAMVRTEQAYALAGQRFRAGLSTYLTVLNAEAGMLNQQRLAADLAARELGAQIALARALGGGYANPQQAATAAAVGPAS